MSAIGTIDGVLAEAAIAGAFRGYEIRLRDDPAHAAIQLWARNTTTWDAAYETLGYREIETRMWNADGVQWVREVARALVEQMEASRLRWLRTQEWRP